MKTLRVLGVVEVRALPDHATKYCRVETEYRPLFDPNGIGNEVDIRQVDLPIWHLARMEDGKMSDYWYAVNEKIINDAWQSDREERTKLFNQWCDMNERIHNQPFLGRLRYLFTGRLEKRSERMRLRDIGKLGI